MAIHVCAATLKQVFRRTTKDLAFLAPVSHYNWHVVEPSKAKQRVAILFGGRSAEHEISLLSARFVLESLDRERFEPILVGIDKSGRWLLQDAARLLGQARDPRQVALDGSTMPVLLPAHPTGALTTTSAAPSKLPIDVVFPVLHGPLGEDGTVQGLLELAGVPYVGSGVLGSAVGMDKDVMKRLLVAAGLPVLPYRAVKRSRWEREPSSVLGELEALALPLFVKPANLGSSVGVSRVKERAELGDAIVAAFAYDDKIVVEAGLDRPREIECAVLGGDPPFSSLPGEIVVEHADGFYSYAAKYLDEHGTTTKIPADLSDVESAEARRLALATFETLEAEGLGRVDLFFDRAGHFWVNEINTLPGFTSISMFPKLMEASGIAAHTLVTRLIEDALERAKRRAARRTTAQ
jgi:D-alanine-D-alanine ligase